MDIFVRLYGSAACSTLILNLGRFNGKVYCAGTVTSRVHFGRRMLLKVTKTP